MNKDMDYSDPTREQPLERSLPHSAEAERAILGGVLLNNSLIAQAVELTQPEDYYIPSNRHIFIAQIALFQRGEAIDPILVAEELKKENRLESVGGVVYITNLTYGLPHSTNIAHYAKVVRGKSMLRQLIRAANKITQEALEQEEAPEVILENAGKGVFELFLEGTESHFEHVAPIVRRSIEKVEAIHQSGNVLTGVPTGYSDLDQLTSGWQKQDLIILAARPSVGKTAMALMLAANAAFLSHSRIAFFSLEMPKEGLGNRLLCAHARVDSQKYRNGYMNAQEWARIRDAEEEINQREIFIEDSAGLTPLRLRAKAKRLAMEYGLLDLIIVDYIGLMSGSGKRYESRRVEIGSITRELKGIAKELNTPLIALSQLNRALEGRADHRPQLADLRECVSGNTRVSLADGRCIPIKELVGENPDVFGLNVDTLKIEKGKADVWSVGERAVFRVTLRSGLEIMCTSGHKFFAWGGWRELKNLNPKDRVARARVLPEIENPTEWPELRLAFLGQMIGDGSYLTGYCPRYTTSSEENSEIITRAVIEEFGLRVTRTDKIGSCSWWQLYFTGNGNRWHPAGVNKWFKDLGIHNQRSHEKRLPRAAFQLSTWQTALLLRHLWAADGSTKHAVYYGTDSYGLATDVAHLLLRLGIISRISPGPTYGVLVTGADEERSFFAKVGTFGPRVADGLQRQDELVNVTANTNVDTLPREVYDYFEKACVAKNIHPRDIFPWGLRMARRHAPSRAKVKWMSEQIQDSHLLKLATSDLFWDEIKSIESAGEEKVYDISVPGLNSWIAEGIITHNSGDIEQDADVVAFIYRPAMYLPKPMNDEETDNTAEIIVAKQRNGPTDTVRLRFDPPTGRFDPLYSTN